MWKKKGGGDLWKSKESKEGASPRTVSLVMCKHIFSNLYKKDFKKSSLF